MAYHSLPLVSYLCRYKYLAVALWRKALLVLQSATTCKPRLKHTPLQVLETCFLIFCNDALRHLSFLDRKGHGALDITPLVRGLPVCLSAGHLPSYFLGRQCGWAQSILIGPSDEYHHMPIFFGSGSKCQSGDISYHSLYLKVVLDTWGFIRERLIIRGLKKRHLPFAMVIVRGLNEHHPLFTGS